MTSRQTPKFHPTDFDIIVSWLAQFNPDELPSDLQSFPLTDIQASMGRVVVLLANMVCGFDSRCSSPKKAADQPILFTEQEDVQFEKLQCLYRIRRFHSLTDNGHDAETAASMMGTSLYQGTVEAVAPLKLSPRMLIDEYYHQKKLKKFLFDVLERKAEEAQLELLSSLGVDVSPSTSEKKKKKKMHQKKQKKSNIQPKESLTAGKNQIKDEDKENSNDIDSGASKTPKRVSFNKQVINKRINSDGGVRKSNVEMKEILKKDSYVNTPRSSEILAHLMIPVIDYDDRVSETALPCPNLKDISTDAITQSIVPPMSPTESGVVNTKSEITKFPSHANSDFAALVSEIENLKSENKILRSEVASANQYLTEAVQRVQLKAYIAESACDAAQERVNLLEGLLVQVIDGKIAPSELQEVMIEMQEQSGSPMASSLSTLNNQLPRDTVIRTDSSAGEPLRDELLTHQRVLSNLRRGLNV